MARRGGTLSRPSRSSDPAGEENGISMVSTPHTSEPNQRPLPEGWAWTTLGKSCDIVLGQSPSSDTYNADGNGLPFYQGKAEFGDLYPTPEKWCSSPKKIAEENDILISVRAPVGPTNLCQEKSCIGRGLAAIRPRNGMPTKFYLYFLRYIEKEWDAKATGTTFKAITGDVLRNQDIPLPPLPEQERIVARLEELLSDLEAGVAALERVRAGVKRYKASVLKAACEGKLFGDEEIENGEMPVGWHLTTVGEVADHRLGKMLDKEKNKGELRPYLRNINVRWFDFDLSDIQYMRVMDSELESISVRKGDLIICEGGEPGRSAVWNQNEPFMIQKALHRVRLNDRVLPIFLVYRLSLDATTGKLERYFTGSTIKHFTGQSLHIYEFPLPPPEEQRRIVAEVDRRLESARAVEAAVEAGLKRAARLRQAVLRAAFEGRLSTDSITDKRIGAD